MEFVLIVAGLVGLLVGGEMLVRGAVALARRLGISPMVIGLTLVGFGTSMPEMLTSVQAALAGSPGIAVGNVVGSNICNILLIIGIAAMLRPIAVDRDGLNRDGTVMAVVAVLGLAAVMWGTIGPWTGAGFVLGLLVYLALTLLAERRRHSAAAAIYEGEAEMHSTHAVPVWRSFLAFAVGLALTLFAARALVTGAISLAAGLGVSEAVIGLTIVAVGTSLPELVTSVIAARRGEGGVALGNIVGSNIFNILGILGVTAMVRPLPVPESIVAMDIWVMLGATLLLVVFARTGWRIGRHEGGILAAGYAAYLGVLTWQAV